MFIVFVAKSSSHKYLYEELQSLEKLGELKSVSIKRRDGEKQRTITYRYANKIGLTGAQDSVEVNWVDIAITNEKGKVTFHNAFVTNHSINDENVAEVVEAGRCRWKIENEDFNTLKTKGYHFEHNFGHGKLYLSQMLLSLNILAFYFHTVLELLDGPYAWLRKTLPRRDTFFHQISTLTQYLCFASWQSLLKFMIRGIKDGPRPPPDIDSIID